MIDVGAMRYATWTVSCYDANTGNVRDYMREFAAAIKTKCGVEPYRLYMSPATLAAFTEMGLERGWEISETSQLDLGEIMFVADNNPIAMGRLRIMNLRTP